MQEYAGKNDLKKAQSWPQILKKQLLNTRLMQGILIAIGMLVYGNTISHKWAIDDNLLITNNRFTQRGVAGMDSLFLTDMLYPYLGKDVVAVAGGRWRPLTPMMFALETELFAPPLKSSSGQSVIDKAGYTLYDTRPESNLPYFSHAINIIFYGLLCGLLYRSLLLLMNGQKKTTSPQPYFISFVAALLFAVHPIHTEVVANVKGRDEIICLSLALSALNWFLRMWYNPESTSKAYFWGLLSLFLALLAKEMAITFILIIPLALFCFTTAPVKYILSRVGLPLLMIGLLFIGLRSAILGQQSVINDFETDEMLNNPFITISDTVTRIPLIGESDVQKIAYYTPNSYFQMPYSNQLALVVHTAGYYIRLMAYPKDLTSDYYPNFFRLQSLSDIGNITVLLLHIAVLIAGLKYMRQKPILSFGILYYFITLSLVSNLFFPIGTNMAERFLFMPSVGLFLVVGYAIYSLQKYGRIYFIIGNVVLGISCFAFIYKTIERNKDWKDNYTLHAKDVKTSANSAKINTEFAALLLIEDEKQQEKDLKSITVLPALVQQVAIKTLDEVRKERVKTILPYLKKSLKMHPASASSWMYYGIAHRLLAEMEADNTQAETYYKHSISALEEAYYFRYTDEKIKNHLSGSYTAFAKYYGEKKGATDSAITMLKKALSIDSAQAKTYYLLGTAYSVKKDYDAAIKYTEKAAAVDSVSLYIKENLAAAYQIKGKVTQNKDYLIKANNLLVTTLKIYRELEDTDIDKKRGLIRVLDLLQINCELMGQKEKQKEYITELKKLQL